MEYSPWGHKELDMAELTEHSRAQPVDNVDSLSKGTQSCIHM